MVSKGPLSLKKKCNLAKASFAPEFYASEQKKSSFDVISRSIPKFVFTILNVLALQFLDGGTQPEFHFFLSAFPVGGTFERTDRLSSGVERDMVAGHLLASPLLGDGVQQNAIFVTIRVVPRHIPVIDARHRHRSVEQRPLYFGVSGGRFVPPAFDQVKLGFEQPNQIGLARHKTPPDCMGGSSFNALAISSMAGNRRSRSSSRHCR